MLSPKIDLTERWDFGDRVGGIMDFEVPQDVYDELMTSEQYDSLCRWESIFGKRLHENQKRHIFPVISSYNTKCTCCGKELRAPWMQSCFSSVCQDCEKESRCNSSRFPWKSNIVSVGHFDDKGYRLFNSK